MSKNCSLPQPQALHVVITHASHRYMLCWLCAVLAVRCVCCVHCVRCVLCWYMLCLLCAVLAVCCACCAGCVLRWLCASSIYILCASSLYIYCVQFVTICLLRTQSRPKFYSGVKKKPFAQQKATKILQRCKETVACAAKSGRNCAAE